MNLPLPKNSALSIGRIEVYGLLKFFAGFFRLALPVVNQPEA